MQSQQGRGQKYDEKAKRKQERHRAQERAHRVGKRAVQHCCQWGCKEKNYSHAKQAEANEKTGHAKKGAAVLLTQARGVSYVHERVFDNRLLYVSELRKMGAEIVTTGTTTAIISGPTSLIGSSVRALDVRAGAALILAGLAASGRTEIADVYHVNRGYERIGGKLRGLGAAIERA